MQDGDPDITGGLLIEENTEIDLSSLPIFAPHMFSYVKRVIVPRFARQFGEDPDDLEQEYWVRVLKSAHLLANIEYPKSWAWATVLHLCINRKRDTRLERESTVAIESPEALGFTSDGPEEALIRKTGKGQLCERVRSLVNALPPGKRQVVGLFLLEKSAKEIGEETQLSRATIYRRKEEAKAILKVIVQELGVEEELENYLADLIARSFLERSANERATNSHA
jgi:RNA polymerase sigma factor (sigma-70 family)